VSYPALDVPRIGGGSLIALVAIVHVFIAHFAVGAGIFNALAETLARRRSDALLLRFIRDASKVLVLIPFVLGAVTGVGIWFTIAVVAPRATSMLIHNFVWGWATEWVFFFVEIASGYVYYYGWDRLSPRRHLIVGWVYAAAAWLSLVVINGIITFMLTPGGWHTLRAEGRWDAAFWAGILNPTYWPSLVLRTVSALAIAGIAACVLVHFLKSYTRDDRTHIIRIASWFMLPLLLMPPVAIWYFFQVPRYPRDLPFGGSVAMSMFFVFGGICSALIFLYALGVIRRREHVSLGSALVLLSMAFVATGSMEYVREGIRKPYVIRGLLWSNGIADQPAEVARLNSEGILANSPWIAPAEHLAAASPKKRGEWVFKAECIQCHTVDGVNGIAPLVLGWNRDMLALNIRYLHRLRGYMPPFIGTADERDALTEFLFSLNPTNREDTAVPVADAAAREVPP